LLADLAAAGRAGTDEKAAHADTRRELERVRNSAEHFKGLWEESCQHVAEACAILGVDAKEQPADTWTLREVAQRAIAASRELRAALLQLATELDLVPACPAEVLIGSVLDKTAWLDPSHG
jgi:hypothetical protein